MFFIGYSCRDSDPEDCFHPLPKGLAENIEMFASSSSSSDEDLSSHGKSIKALMGHSDSTNCKGSNISSSENEFDNFEKSSKSKPYADTMQTTSVNFLAPYKEESAISQSLRHGSSIASTKRVHKSDSQLIEEEVLKYLARGPMNSKTLVKKLKRKLPDMHPENFLRNISCIMKSCNVEKHQMRDGKVIFKLK